MSKDGVLQEAPGSLIDGTDEGCRSPINSADDALLIEMDEFFSLGKNTDRIRRFIEENDGTLSLVATGGGCDTNSRAGMQLYQLFQHFVKLIEDIVGDFVASREQNESDILPSLVTAIKKEWNSSENAYRLLSTSYIAASLDYSVFLEFAEDLYGNLHYSMVLDDEHLESAECSGSGYGFDDAQNTEGNDPARL
ncbi:hypothetical protein ABL78_0194 [Leptomonas seymouri]|uniref:BART domain-containing protein n=1 Tax=Leptomonas seymouri TaxID=5684 RepID=A0A0N1ICH3_LEPSE|nr:hypothetical protein ABL78_0194 [Leptomonas seymouri]|eukprot:KPI90758.1 hypothetical protein ABL78_0194 [Leptomonas seymouri]